MSNHTRTFLFKFYNNLLGLNSRVAHFVRGHPRTCTFCDIRHDPDPNPENTLHLFFECVYVQGALREFFGWIFGSQLPYDIGLREFFIGFNFDNVNKSKVLDLILILVKKIIWDCKLRFTVPDSELLKKCFLEEYKKIHNASGYVRSVTAKSDIFLNRADIRF